MLNVVKALALAFTFLAWLGLAARPARAIPLFAHQYGVTCQKCHSIIPRLNTFGLQFMAHGNRMLGIEPGPAFPIAMKANLVGSNQNQGEGSDGSGLPKEIVDEVEGFVAGLVGSRANYFAEQYFVDGGEPGLLREAWVNDRVNPWESRIPVTAQAGLFTLPLPVEPEALRDSYQHYTIFDQTVGNNPFNFFDTKLGAVVSVGDPLRGTNIRAFAGPGHDRQSGLPTIGTDLMAYGQQVIGPFTASTYHYEGTRPSGVLLDRFERQGYGLVFSHRRWTSESVLQTGYDSNPFGTIGIGAASSGGFTQLRYDIGPRLFALGRYEGTNEPNEFTRDGVLLLGYRPTHNAVITLELDASRTPQTTNAVNMQYTVGY
ncbi:MAG: hypothetical protein ACXWNJ_04145 [Vulcanimicrobiaceae bacterium]